MNDSIKLSKKHGVNPTIPICFFCGNEKNEIALLGELPNDAEAPKHTIINYEPCDTCKEIMNKGITVMEVTTKPNAPNQPPIQKNCYPTGRFLTLSKDSAKRSFPTIDVEKDKIILTDYPVMEGMLQALKENQ